MLLAFRACIYASDAGLYAAVKLFKVSVSHCLAPEIPIEEFNFELFQSNFRGAMEINFENEILLVLRTVEWTISIRTFQRRTHCVSITF